MSPKVRMMASFCLERAMAKIDIIIGSDADRAARTGEKPDVLREEASYSIPEDGDRMRSANLHQLDRTGRCFLNPLDQSFRNRFIPELVDEFHIASAIFVNRSKVSLASSSSTF